MTIAQILNKMIAASNGNIHDIDHLLRVWAYARTIGELEGLDAETQYLLEVAAITHDIACPLCREKYGNTNGKYQEQEGAVLVRAFLAGTGMTEAQIARVAYLVGHHHTLQNICGMDYQILIEADYIANASENGYGKESIVHFLDTIMKTASANTSPLLYWAFLTPRVPKCSPLRQKAAPCVGYRSYAGRCFCFSPARAPLTAGGKKSSARRGIRRTILCWVSGHAQAKCVVSHRCREWGREER